MISDPRIGDTCPACGAAVTAIQRGLGVWLFVLVVLALGLGWVGLALWH